jgi:hypothetical protein
VLGFSVFAVRLAKAMGGRDTKVGVLATSRAPSTDMIEGKGGVVPAAPLALVGVPVVGVAVVGAGGVAAAVPVVAGAGAGTLEGVVAMAAAAAARGFETFAALAVLGAGGVGVGVPAALLGVVAGVSVAMASCAIPLPEVFAVRPAAASAAKPGSGSIGAAPTALGTWAAAVAPLAAFGVDCGVCAGGGCRLNAISIVAVAALALLSPSSSLRDEFLPGAAAGLVVAPPVLAVAGGCGLLAAGVAGALDAAPLAARIAVKPVSPPAGVRAGAAAGSIGSGATMAGADMMNPSPDPRQQASCHAMKRPIPS